MFKSKRSYFGDHFGVDKELANHLMEGFAKYAIISAGVIGGLVALSAALGGFEEEEQDNVQIEIINIYFDDEE